MISTASSQSLAVQALCFPFLCHRHHFNNSCCRFYHMYSLTDTLHKHSDTHFHMHMHSHIHTHNTHIHTCMHTHKHNILTHTHNALTFTCVHIHIHTIHSHTHACTCSHSYTRACTHAYTQCTCIHTCAHMHTHTHSPTEVVEFQFCLDYYLLPSSHPGCSLYLHFWSTHPSDFFSEPFIWLYDSPEKTVKF